MCGQKNTARQGPFALRKPQDGEAKMGLDVCIIGAGWSGLYACKYALENGLKPIVLERRDDIGGVWNYTDDPATTTVMKSTVSSSSRVVTEASDFFMDENVGHFMHHEEVVNYLRQYTEHFRLTEHIHLGCNVKAVKKVGPTWEVTYEQAGVTHVIRAAKLAVCAGSNHKQKPLSGPVSKFSGQLWHAGDLKEVRPGDFSEQDRVLIYGGGETASDLVDLLVKTPARVTWAIRGGQHFLRKTPFHSRPGPGLFRKHDFPLDQLASPLIAAASPFKKGAPGRRYIADFLSTGRLRGYFGHGVPVWRNRFRYGQQFFNKNGHAVEHVATGRVTPQNDVVAVRGNEVEFQSGERAAFTHVICCFGYQFDCPFLPQPYNRGDLDEHFHFVFPVDDPALAFLGFSRPIIGSIPLMTEMQCLWVFRVWAGKVSLPPAQEQRIRQQNLNQRWGQRLPGRGRMKTLVHPSTYAAHMMKAAYPDRKPGDVFKKNPLRALRFLTWIPSASMLRAFDPELGGAEFKRLWRQRRQGFLIGWLLPLWVVVGRLLRIENLIDWSIRRQSGTPLMVTAENEDMQKTEVDSVKLADYRTFDGPSAEAISEHSNKRAA